MQIRTKQEFDEQVLQAKVPVLAEFHMRDSGVNAAQRDALRQLEQTGAVRVCSVDVTQQPMLPGRFGLLSQPAMLLFRNGRVTAAAVGAQSYGELIAMLTGRPRRVIRSEG